MSLPGTPTDQLPVQPVPPAKPEIEAIQPAAQPLPLASDAQVVQPTAQPIQPAPPLQGTTPPAFGAQNTAASTRNTDRLLLDDLPDRPMRSVDALVLQVAKHPELIELIKADPVRELGILASRMTEIIQPAEPVLDSDIWIYRIVVGALALTILIAIVGAFFLAAARKDVPSVLTAIGAAAVGAVAGLLAPSPMSNNKNQG